jgi:ADP-heptose:LPS heptosyltransferase
MSNKLITTLGRLLYCCKKRKLPQKIDKILISKIGAIGDVIMTTPLVHSLRKRFPNAKIDYAVGGYSFKALTENPDISEIVNFDDKIVHHKKLGGLIKHAKRLRKFKYDLIINLDKSWMLGVFCSFCAPFRIGFDRFGEGFANNLNKPYANDKHEIDYYFDVGDLLGCERKDKKTRITLVKQDKDFANEFFKTNKLKKDVIAIVPGGSCNVGETLRIRILPKELVLELLNALTADHDIILAGGPSDEKYYQELLKEVKAKNKIVSAAKTSIKEIVAIFAKCSAVICNDSGSMHMAGNVNKNIVAIFGPSMPMRKGPLHRNSICIWKDRDIYEPEYEICGKPPKSRDFMKKITCEEILKAVKTYFK